MNLCQEKLTTLNILGIISKLEKAGQIFFNFQIIFDPRHPELKMKKLNSV